MKNTINTLNGSTKKWKEKLIKLVENQVETNDAIQFFHNSKKIGKGKAGVHLAIFNEPFLSLLMKGEKTIESRFSINKVPPFDKVHAGDIVLVKKSGGEVIGFFAVEKVEYYNTPSPTKLQILKKDYSNGIGAYAVRNFWENKQHTRYISLLHILQMTKINPVTIEKKDRTAWAVLRLNANMKQNELWQK